MLQMYVQRCCDSHNRTSLPSLHVCKVLTLHISLHPIAGLQMPRSHRLPMCHKFVGLFLDLIMVQIYCKYYICYSFKIRLLWYLLCCKFSAIFKSILHLSFDNRMLFLLFNFKQLAEMHVHLFQFYLAQIYGRDKLNK